MTVGRQKGRREVGKLYCEKRKDFRCVIMEGYLYEEVSDVLIRNRAA